MIKQYKCNNAYVLWSSIILLALFVIMFCTVGRKAQHIGVYAFFILMFITDIARNTNVTIELYEDKLIQRQGKKHHTTIYFTEITKFQAFGWYHVPLCWKAISIQNANKDTICIRSIGCKEYRELWLEVYKRVKANSKMAVTNDNLEKAIEKIKEEQKEKGERYYV